MNELLAPLLEHLRSLSTDELVEAINEVKLELHKLSPHRAEPVDCVLWKKADQLHANAYNPNTVAPTELDLLKLSIISDGYTQPIVVWGDGGESYEIVDGFHRNRCGREVGKIQKRVLGYLPVVVMNTERTSKEDRVAATIRHNRARGKHGIEAMSEIVIDLVRRNKTDEWISKELGMDQDEVLRLKQTTGLAELFAQGEFSQAWEPED